MKYEYIYLDNNLESEGLIMDKIIINGGRVLKGTVRVEGAKNAVLPVLGSRITRIRRS